ncbi:MAG: fibronectin type III domain-containing protein, partial [Myxococcaceae bacterium]|nr:fibronectin type III domain-containing protein [Myxococcaceae bacterium]
MLLRALLTSSVALGLLGGCPPGGGVDAGAVGGGAGGGVAEDAGQGGGGQVLLNPSRFNIVLGRPTDTSIAVSVLASAPGDQVFVEYAARLTGDEQGLLDAARSPTARSMSGEPMVVELTGLSPNTRYFDRVVVQPAGQAAQADALHTFHTHRARGAAFHFGVQGDTHPERWNGKMFHGELFTLTMQEVARRQPDFYGTLGDDFSSEKIIQDFKAANFAAGHRFTRAVEGVAPYETYRALTRPFVEAMLVAGERAPTGSAAWRELRQRYFGLMTPSTALFLVNG